MTKYKLLKKKIRKFRKICLIAGFMIAKNLVIL